VLLVWEAQDIFTLAGYILGSPSDAPETIRRDIAIIQEELPLDIKFSCVTRCRARRIIRFSGRRASRWRPKQVRGARLHCPSAHEEGAVGNDLSRSVVTFLHSETLLRRAVATGVPVDSLIKVLVNFATTAKLENVHTLPGGILRLKHPSERRSGLPPKSALIFWPRFVRDTLSKHAVIVATIARLLLRFVITRDAGARMYKDTALTVGDDKKATLDLLTNTTGVHAVAAFEEVARVTGVARVV
jgi:hypothetical protein